MEEHNYIKMNYLIKVGAESADFSLKDQNGETVSLKSFRGKKVLLSWHPLAWTSVCMDQIVVDVSNLAIVACGDSATLIGADGNERITAEELATLADTIPYDILTGIGPRVHREYIGG